MHPSIFVPFCAKKANLGHFSYTFADVFCEISVTLLDTKKFKEAYN